MFVAITVVLLCLQVFLKNVLQVVISHRTSWKLDGQNFQYSFGNGVSRSKPLLENSHLPPQVQTALAQYAPEERQETESVARLPSKGTGVWEPINLFHLRDALLVGGIGGCQAVCIVNDQVKAANKQGAP